VGLSIAAALTLGLLAVNQFAGPLPPRSVTIATGRAGGAYHQYALEYRRLLARQGYRLEIVAGPGSVATFEQLAVGRVDAGFLQGGVVRDARGVQAVASLFYEPLWVFHRRALPLSSLADLKGRRVGVGEPGSGVRELALRLLADNGVTAANTVLVEASLADAETALGTGRLDAALFVVSPRAELVRRLLAHPDIELMTERRHLAYAARYPFLAPLRLAEGTLDMARDIPREDRVVVGATAALAVRPGIHPDLVRVLLAAADAVHRNGGLLERRGEFPSAAGLELPLHEEARRYLATGPSWLERHVPFWVAGLLARALLVVVPAATVLFPVFGFVLPRVGEARQRARLRRRSRALRDSGVADAGVPESCEAAMVRLRELRQALLADAARHPEELMELLHLVMHVDLVLDRLDRRRNPG
jgi:TRAP transporter TAXI family solute receptor